MSLSPTDQSPARAAEPKEPPNWAEPLGQMAFGAMLVGSLFVASEGAATLWHAYRVDYTYAPTTARVLAADLGAREDNRGKTVYRPKLHLRYDAGGVVREE